MTLITMQNGKVIMKNGKVATGTGCCCGAVVGAGILAENGLRLNTEDSNVISQE